MAEIAFYHLQTISLESALPQLLVKCMQRSWRSLVEVGDAETLSMLDEHLWTYDESSFLAHASPRSAPREEAERHPIWLQLLSETAAGANPNRADILFYVAGALPPENADLNPFTRVLLLFDGGQEADVHAARGVWKRLRDGGHSLSYWKQSESSAWQRADGG